MLIRDNGPVKVLLVPSEEQRLGPTIGPRGAWVLTRGGLDPVRHGNAPWGLNLGNGGLESNLGWDKWRWGLDVGTRWLVSIYPWHF